ncbi:hypothetical protein GOODEAATRI_016880 [Goodea atripinnis]|uniref:Secreted protein n=1 Tax=Goodea atripinnis TaxID=208336 RepID=A0ABV0PEP0_9TELE
MCRVRKKAKALNTLLCSHFFILHTSQVCSLRTGINSLAFMRRAGKQSQQISIAAAPEVLVCVRNCKEHFGRFQMSIGSYLCYKFKLWIQKHGKKSENIFCIC